MKIITIDNFEFPSYATVEESNKYFAAKFGSSWKDIPEEDKSKLLVTATREIEKAEFKGCKEDIEQELKFPRLIYPCVCTSVYPEKELIACCCEIANAIYNLPIIEGTTTPGIDKIKSMTIGDTSITYQDGVKIEADSFSATASPFIKKYLGKFLKGNIRIIL